MKIKLSVTEFLNVCKAIQLRPERVLKMIRTEIRESTGRYLNELMKGELAEYLDRKPYERKKGESNHRNGFYHRNLTLRGWCWDCSQGTRNLPAVGGSFLRT